MNNDQENQDMDKGNDSGEIGSKGMVKALLSALIDVSPETLVQYTSRDFVISQQESLLQQQPNGSSSNNSNLSTEKAVRSICEEKIVTTDRVGINDLINNVNQVMEGKYFLGRTITFPVQTSDTITTVAEDPSGVLAIRINFYNGDLASIMKELVISSIVVISNPWFKVTTSDGGLGLRIDDPSNFSTLSESSFLQWFPDLKWESQTSSTPLSSETNKKAEGLSNGKDSEDFKKWKRLGNEKFVERRYMEALKAYNVCLEISPGDLDTLSNRAAVFLRMAWFKLALTDTDNVLEIDPAHIKAIYRKTKALHGLNECKEATNFLKGQLKYVDKEAKKQIIIGEIKKSESMENQQKCGRYDVLGMLRNDGKRIEDCVEYLGPIKFESAPRAGRGVVTTRNMYAGELVMAVRAFEIVFNFGSFADITTDPGSTKLLDNSEDFESESRKELTSAIVNRLKMDAAHGKELYKLYAGPHLGVPNTDFDCRKVYQKRISAIVTFNSFRSHSSETDVIFDEPFPSGKTKGIWLQTSYMNHNCFDHNCVWYTIGDFMFIRTCRDVDVDEELTITYFKPLPEYVERRELIKEYGFSCDCRLCNLEPNISEEKIQLRDRIVDGFQRSAQNDTATLRLTLECIEKMKQLVPIETMNLDLMDMYDHLSTIYMSEGNYIKSLEQLEKGYYIAKANPTCCSQAVRFATSIIVVILRDAGKEEVELARQWVERLTTDLNIAIGTVDIFKLTHNGKIIVGLLTQNGIEF